MSLLTIKYAANFLAIIALASAIDSQKEGIAGYFSAASEDADPQTLVRGIQTINTMSLTFVSAINAFCCFSERSEYHLTLLGFAYLVDLTVAWYLILKLERKNNTKVAAAPHGEKK